MSDIKILRPIIDAKEFIRNYRMRFASLYPGDLTFFATCLTHAHNSDIGWENGVLVGDSTYAREEMQLTDAGWKSFVNANEIPTSWDEANSYAAIFNIPDDVSKEWLQEISMFLYHVDKLDVAAFKNYVTAYQALKGMAEVYQRDYVSRAVSGLESVKRVIAEKKVRERIRAIEVERSKPKGYVEPLPLMVGSVVRLRTGVDESTVKEKDLTFAMGNVICKTAVRLETPLEECCLWNAGDLFVVRNPVK